MDPAFFTELKSVPPDLQPFFYAPEFFQHFTLRYFPYGLKPHKKPFCRKMSERQLYEILDLFLCRVLKIPLDLEKLIISYMPKRVGYTIKITQSGWPDPDEQHIDISFSKNYIFRITLNFSDKKIIMKIV